MRPRACSPRPDDQDLYRWFLSSAAFRFGVYSYSTARKQYPGVMAENGTGCLLSKGEWHGANCRGHSDRVTRGDSNHFRRTWRPSVFSSVGQSDGAIYFGWIVPGETTCAGRQVWVNAIRYWRDGSADTLFLPAGEYEFSVESYACNGKDYLAARPVHETLRVEAGQRVAKDISLDVRQIKSLRSYNNPHGKSCEPSRH